MSVFIPVSEAKGKLSEIVRDSDNEDVVLMRHGRPAAVVMSVDRHDAMMEAMEDLRDRLSVYESSGTAIDFEKFAFEFIDVHEEK